jgi:hypothetical protein
MFTVDEVERGVGAFGAALASLPTLQRRKIWFWQIASYQHDGWIVRHPSGGFGFHVRPLAVRHTH